VEGTKRAMSQLLGKDDIDPVLVSAKEGIGIEELIDRLVKEIPAPNGMKMLLYRLLCSIPLRYLQRSSFRCSHFQWTG